MGPITGIRIVNLRVRDKVAYPDLTLDLAGEHADHLVIGLENGGGKSTLLGAVYHVFVPEADQFLPRRAQRRQGKEGELKRLEHYVPGGDPTHFIVEVEVPSTEGTLPLVSTPRILFGACLWKAAGSPPSTLANEFFWSARGVGRDLTLQHLVLRGAGGRLLDHREFRAKLKQLRAEIPSAQVNVEEAKGAWQLHLSSLGIDIEFVRQFLLRMNEDEGAADQVFTYASSRAFLNSLVGVVGDPTTVGQLKQRLVETAADADGLLVDRQRVLLLENLTATTGPLAESVAEIYGGIARRNGTIGHLRGTHQRLSGDLEDARKAAVEAKESRAKLERAALQARGEYDDAHARFVRARVQFAQVRRDEAAREILVAEEERVAARERERVALAAALIADRRTAETRIRDIEDVLRGKISEAEPLRASLSSAVQALHRRLSIEHDGVERERAAMAVVSMRATEDGKKASEEHTTAEKKLGELSGERRTLTAERAELERQIIAAVETGLLPLPESDPSILASSARAESAAALATATEHEHRRQVAVGALGELVQRDRDLAAAAARTQAVLPGAQRALETATNRTEDLCNSLSTSGFVEVHPVVLDDHADVIKERLEHALVSARRKQGMAAVSVAAAERAATWLANHERLPPRPDVERLCERARASRLGAHPGWTYLSTLGAEVASGYVAHQPGLADGIVVNVPEDFDAIVTLIAAARDELQGPVVVGAAAMFDATHVDDERAAVILPLDAYWSTAAGRELTTTRTAEAARWAAEHDDATARADAALTLREQLTAWTIDIGAGGLDVLRGDIDDLQQAAHEIASKLRAVSGEIVCQTAERDGAEADRDRARGRGHAELQRAQELDALARVRARRAAIDGRVEIIADDEAGAATARDTAVVAVADAMRRRDDAAGRIEQLAAMSGELINQRSETAALAAVVVQPADVVDEGHEETDRQLLLLQVRDRENRWRGAITDPELRAQLGTLQSALAENEKRLGDYENVLDRARELVVLAPARSADRYREDSANARRQIEQLGERLGHAKAVALQLENELDQVLDELRRLRRPAELAPSETTSNLEAAATVRQQLLDARELAMRMRSVREAEQQVATEFERFTVDRVALLELVTQRLMAAMRQLASGGVLVPAVDSLELEVSEDEMSAPGAAGLREALTKLLGTATRMDDSSNDARLDALRTANNSALEEIDADVERLQRHLTTLENSATAALDAAEALLRDAAEEVVRGDMLVQLMRAAPRRKLADLAVQHHDDIIQRLVATRHHVASFDARLEAVADTVYATMADLLREVRRTVRESQLPNTPAMGRWAGAELLKLSGLDTLKVEQRRAAISMTLRGWFSPERPSARPRQFDSDDVVHDLLRAITPQFAARILIPSDPLDPEHKPVDHLALETSGGEGVTVALILASLLASRRASSRGHRRTTLMLDNPFAKVTKPEFLRLARDVANELNVQLVAFTGIRDIGALTVFPRFTQLRVSRRENANFVVPYEIDDEHLQSLLRDGTLYVSPTEWEVAGRDGDASAWPLVSAVSVVERETET